MIKKFFTDEFLFFCIFLLGAFIRLERVRDYLVFLGDEGRDVLVVKRIIVDHALTLLGPITSVGGMYLGPIYYYFMTPFLWLFQLDPVGPAIMIVGMWLVTVFFIYRLGKQFLNTETGLIASLLYALSPIVIIYSRSSWNPNAVPLFAIIMIYSILQVIVKQRFSWLFCLGLALGVIVQLHYLALIFVGILISVYCLFRPSLRKSHFALLLLGFVIAFSPFLFFELRHGFPNTQTVLRFVTKGGSDSTFSFFTALTKGPVILTRLFGKLIVNDTGIIAKVLIFSLAVFFTWLFLKSKRALTNERRVLKLLFLWLAVGVVAYGLYTGSIYDYYFAPLFPLPFLLTGFMLSKFLSSGSAGKIITFFILGAVIALYLNHLPQKQEPNRLLHQTEVISAFAYSRTEGKPYNFALISSGNSDHAYRYFFELWGNKPVTIENTIVDLDRKSRTKQLIVICEDKQCQPLGHSLWEIAGYGNAEVQGQWDIVNVKIFKLVSLTS